MSASLATPHVGSGAAAALPADGADPRAAEIARLSAELDTYKRWVARAADVCERAARGDLERRLLSIEVGGDLGRLLHGINDTLDVTDAFVREAGVSLRCASEGNFHRKIVTNGLLGAFRQSTDAINQAARAMARKTAELEAARESRQRLAGDFDEFVNSLVARLGSAVESLTATAGEIVLKVETARQQAETVDGASREVSTEVRAVAAATEALVASAAAIAAQTRDSTNLCQAALGVAGQSSDTVAALAEASRKIGSVLKLIADIAHQTNLLALNATIEAARAGEAGKGFAVVASAVKGLSRQTAGATAEIEREISSMRDATSRTVAAIDRVAGTMRDLDSIAASIANAVEGQRGSTSDIGSGLTRAATRSHDVAGTIAEVCAATRTSASSLADVLSAIHGVGHEVQKLRDEANRFLGQIRAE